MENMAGRAMEKMRGSMRAVPILFWFCKVSSIESKTLPFRKHDVLVAPGPEGGLISFLVHRMMRNFLSIAKFGGFGKSKNEREIRGFLDLP